MPTLCRFATLRNTSSRVELKWKKKINKKNRQSSCLYILKTHPIVMHRPPLHGVERFIDFNAKKITKSPCSTWQKKLGLHSPGKSFAHFNINGGNYILAHFSSSALFAGYQYTRPLFDHLNNLHGKLTDDKYIHIWVLYQVSNWMILWRWLSIHLFINYYRRKHDNKDN
jgi:hypothetical protein